MTSHSWIDRRREIGRRIVREFAGENIKEEGEGGGNRDNDNSEDTIPDVDPPAAAKEEEGEARPDVAEAEAQVTSKMNNDRERWGNYGDDDVNDTDATSRSWIERRREIGTRITREFLGEKGEKDRERGGGEKEDAGGEKDDKDEEDTDEEERVNIERERHLKRVLGKEGGGEGMNQEEKRGTTNGERVNGGKEGDGENGNDRERGDDGDDEEEGDDINDYPPPSDVGTAVSRKTAARETAAA